MKKFILSNVVVVAAAVVVVAVATVEDASQVFSKQQ